MGVEFQKYFKWNFVRIIPGEIRNYLEWEQLITSPTEN